MKRQPGLRVADVQRTGQRTTSRANAAGKALNGPTTNPEPQQAKANVRPRASWARELLLVEELVDHDRHCCKVKRAIGLQSCAVQVLAEPQVVV